MSAKRMLEEASWAIVGSHGRNPICDRLHTTLIRGQKQVFRVNPGVATDEVFPSLTAIGKHVDVVNLVINPTKGPAVVEEMVRLGIKYLWIQPGAESQQVISLAESKGIQVHKGCVLVEAKF
ncbi:hypothetical protein BASA81_008115 [Batrachochytrium salamandrivorans]|nr:hypothetical protein BASA81_008115 [Batrachochytrium salamandrivorans]